MKSSPSPALNSRSILALVMLAGALSACASPRATIQLASGCSGLVPESIRAPVEAPALPSSDTAGDWIAFGDAAVGRLDTANLHTKAAVEIVERCEARDKTAVAEIERPWWKLW